MISWLNWAFAQFVAFGQAYTAFVWVVLVWAWWAFGWVSKAVCAWWIAGWWRKSEPETGGV